MLRGDFSEVDKNHPRREIPAGPLFRRTARPDIPDDHETVNGNHGSVISHIEERARVSSHSGQTSTHTSHTPAREVPPATTAPADAGGVCVSMPKSRYSREQCVTWAEGRKAEGGKIDPHAVGRARWMDGTEDDEVGKFLGRRELVQEGKRPAERQLTPYHVAAQTVASVAQVPKHDVAGFIAQMQGVSEETRAKLVRTFLPEQARARAPP